MPLNEVALEWERYSGKEWEKTKDQIWMRLACVLPTVTTGKSACADTHCLSESTSSLAT